MSSRRDLLLLFRQPFDTVQQGGHGWADSRHPRRTSVEVAQVAGQQSLHPSTHTARGQESAPFAGGEARQTAADLQGGGGRQLRPLAAEVDGGAVQAHNRHELGVDRLVELTPQQSGQLAAVLDKVLACNLREPRVYVKKVLTNLWSYRARLGQPQPSLEALARNRWPIYRALDGERQMHAWN